MTFEELDAMVQSGRRPTWPTGNRAPTHQHPDLFGGRPIPGWLVQFSVEQEVAGRSALLRETPPEALSSALQETMEVIQRWPVAVEPQRLVCDLLSALDRQEEAVVAWRRLHDQAVGDQSTLWGFATALADLGRHDELLAIMRRLHDQNDTPAIRHGLFVALLRAGRYTEARTLLSQWRQDDPSEFAAAEVLLKQGIVEFLAGEFYASRLALSQYRKPRDRSQSQRPWPSPADIERWKLSCFIEAGQYAEAIADVRQRFSVNHSLGRDLRQQLAFMLPPEQIELALAIANDLLANTGDQQGLEAKGLVVLLLYQAGRFDEAHRRLDEWLSDPLATNRPFYGELRVTVFAEEDRLDDAIEYVRAEARGEGDNRMRRWLMTYLAEANRYDDMEALGMEWIEQDPANEDLLDAALGHQRLEGRLASAERLLLAWQERIAAMRSAEEPPAVVPANSVAGLCRNVRGSLLDQLMVQHRYADAARHGRAFLTDDPNDVELLLMTASAIDQLGDFDAAAAMMVRAQELVMADDFLAPEPTGPLGDDEQRLPFRRLVTRARCLNNLGYLYADNGVKLDDAEKMIRQALDIEREYGGVSISTLDSLGWVQYKLGDSHMGQAGRTFQEVIAGSRRKAAADGSDEHAVLYDHAGDVYYRLRRRDDAIDMWRQALRLARGAELDQDTERIRREAPAKLAAVASGRVPPVAPLGEGVPDDLMRLDEDERIDREAAD